MLDPWHKFWRQSSCWSLDQWQYRCCRGQPCPRRGHPDCMREEYSWGKTTTGGTPRSVSLTGMASSPSRVPNLALSGEMPRVYVSPRSRITPASIRVYSRRSGGTNQGPQTATATEAGTSPGCAFVAALIRVFCPVLPFVPKRRSKQLPRQTLFHGTAVRLGIFICVGG
jgi:hypothetical protein